MIVLMIHGKGGSAGISWQHWLKDQLESRGHFVMAPQMPEPHHPVRDEWLKEIVRQTETKDTTRMVILGHSLGVVTALDYIQQLQQPVHGLVSVSGFCSDFGSERYGYFLREKIIDFSQINTKLRSSLVIFGNDDSYVTRPALQEVADGLDVKAVVVDGGGHFNDVNGQPAFPRLLELMEERLLV